MIPQRQHHPHGRHPEHVARRRDGVRDLQLSGFGSAAQVMGFDIVDVSDRGWEGVSFEIEDYENGVIHFYCRSARIVDVVMTYTGISSMNGAQ